MDKEIHWVWNASFQFLVNYSLFEVKYSMLKKIQANSILRIVMCILSLYLQMYDASCTCTNRSYGIRESRWKLYRSLRQVLNWAAMSYLFLCRLFLPSEQLYCQFLSSSLNSRRCFQTFCHLTTRKRKGNTFYKRKLHKAFWDLHFTSFKLSVALFVRLNCLCTGGIDQTDVML